MSELKVAMSQGGFSQGTKRKLFASGMPGKRGKRKSFKLKGAPGLLRRKGPEIKTVDINQVVHSISTAGNTTLINGLVEGVDANQRVGRRINMKSVKIRMWWATGVMPAAAVDTYCRYILVYDRQPNGAAPTWADIMTNYNVTGATDSTAMAAPNPTNFDRFVILRDGCRCYAPTTTASVNQVAQDDTNFTKQVEEWFVNLKGLESHYIAGAGAGTIADFRTGSLYFFTLGSNTVANTTTTCTITARLRYHDQ